ncbi:MAG: uncharacterized protein KVP18_004734 [Porospora cf. gigantea A]|uniref:uncharacterized protein n=1 Tax=Porospora cf. gigantea A TaxID=2853593 RepID=UPI0035597003|nr:MAG: hypothetical protein KVP18_004734 [Porospora cf. gigantea A]
MKLVSLPKPQLRCLTLASTIGGPRDAELDTASYSGGTSHQISFPLQPVPIRDNVHLTLPRSFYGAPAADQMWGFSTFKPQKNRLADNSKSIFPNEEPEGCGWSLLAKTVPAVPSQGGAGVSAENDQDVVEQPKTDLGKEFLAPDATDLPAWFTNVVGEDIHHWRHLTGFPPTRRGPYDDHLESLNHHEFKRSCKLSNVTLAFICGVALLLIVLAALILGGTGELDAILDFIRVVMTIASVAVTSNTTSAN